MVTDRTPETGPYKKLGIASAGFGLRYALRKNVAFKADLARVFDAGPANITPGSTTTATSTDARGDTTSYYYAELAFPSSPTEVVDSLGTQVSYSAYDDWGNVCVSGSVAPSWGTSTQCSTLSGDTSTTHNALGSETSVTDPSGDTTSAAACA